MSYIFQITQEWKILYIVSVIQILNCIGEVYVDSGHLLTQGSNTRLNKIKQDTYIPRVSHFLLYVRVCEATEPYQ
jgi:hypothetical protein